jgi:hypothetical protein
MVTVEALATLRTIIVRALWLYANERDAWDDALANAVADAVIAEAFDGTAPHPHASKARPRQHKLKRQSKCPTITSIPTTSHSTSPCPSLTSASALSRRNPQPRRLPPKITAKQPRCSNR